MDNGEWYYKTWEMYTNGLDQNYCRNPFGEEDRLWCYTTNPDVEWDYCEPRNILNEEKII